VTLKRVPVLWAVTGTGLWALSACNPPAFVPPSADRLRTDSASFSHRCADQIRQRSAQPGNYLSLEGRAQWARSVQRDVYSVIDEYDARLADTSTGRWVSFRRGVILVGFGPSTGERALQRLADGVNGRVGEVRRYPFPWPGWMKVHVRPGDEVSAALSLLYDCRVYGIGLNNTGPRLETSEPTQPPPDSAKHLSPGA